MYFDNMRAISAIRNIERTVDLITAVHEFSVEEIMEHMATSRCIEHVTRGDVLYADSSVLALVLCLAEELQLSDDEKKEMARRFLTMDFRGANVGLYWLTHTEIEIAIRTGKTIAELRSIISIPELMNISSIYSPYFVSDAIAKEHYHLEVLDES